MDPVAEPGPGPGVRRRAAPGRSWSWSAATRREKISNDSEQDITNALIKVTRDAQQDGLLRRGRGRARHRRHAATAGSRASRRRSAKSQYETQKVLLLREGKVPADCTVAGGGRSRRRTCCPPVVDALRGLREAGRQGRSSWSEPEIKVETPQPRRAAQGVEPRGRARRGGGRLRAWASSSAPARVTPLVRPSTRTTRSPRTSGLMTAFHTARSVKAGTGNVGGRVRAEPASRPRRASWAETDLTLQGARSRSTRARTRKGPVLAGRRGHRARPARRRALARRRRPRRRRPSPEADAGAAEGRGPRGGVRRRRLREQPLLGFQGNQDFFLNTVAWLAEDADLISIRPKEPDDQRMFLTAAAAAERRRSAGARPAARPLRGRSAIATWWRRRSDEGARPFWKTLRGAGRGAGLGAYIYFVESKQRGRSPTKPKEKVFALDKAEGEGAGRSRPPAASASTWSKEGDAWRLTAPAPAAPADAHARSTPCSRASRRWRSTRWWRENAERPRRSTASTRRARTVSGAARRARASP